VMGAHFVARPESAELGHADAEEGDAPKTAPTSRRNWLLPRLPTSNAIELIAGSKRRDCREG